MKAIILTIVSSISVLSPVLAYDTNVLGDEQARVSYAIGMMWGGQLKTSEVTNLNYDLLMRGMKDAQAGGTLLTTAEMHNTMNLFFQELRAQAEKRRQEVAEKNQKAGEVFLTRNKEKKGVVTLPDGMQYKIITNGTGSSP